MNAEDLKALAQRSWELEDNTHARLADVHARIDDARHRRRSTTALVSVMAALVIVATVIAFATSSNDNRPQPAPPPEPRPSVSLDPELAPADAPHRPADGTCWSVPPVLLVDTDYWQDDSPQVPCDHAHTTETAAVLTLPEPTLEEARKRAFDLCWDQAGTYLGITQRSWILFAAVALLPTQAQIDDGASWVRCDVWFPTRLDLSGARVTSGTSRGVAAAPPPELWGCLDEPLTVPDQPLVACSRPHVYEQTGRVALLQRQATYPTQQQRRTAEVQCEDGIPPRLAGYPVAVAWDPPDTFVPNSDVAGVCLVHSPPGGTLPARPPTEGQRS
ncbi:hypothetical protein ASC77_05125 [Nocardioides sp. Root1257]|uniref:septum formation family protein n=1 Tax=unclassified Nocardioides TaxID=2615069 RepID=UPI0006FB916B|nr:MULTISPECIES: septum formation family protein [unclassified Nocardioides]KQW53652.1 hypothetical protein ASC77_05125 [Nocardioides sp. Root1257]KRC56338.1 hypothetical protein ASE24_05125 [Nocardioides sp. Root224]